MRTAKFILSLLLLSAAGYAQQSGSNPSTVSGCLVSVNGVFTLIAPNGERYLLKGDHDTLFSYNGKQVQVTGTPKSTKKSASGAMPVKFEVSAIKKLADVCQ